MIGAMISRSPANKHASAMMKVITTAIRGSSPKSELAKGKDLDGIPFGEP
jgi:hypothetical protein